MSVQIEKPKVQKAEYVLNRLSMALLGVAQKAKKRGIMLEPEQPAPEGEAPLFTLEALSDNVGRGDTRELVFKITMNTTDGVKSFRAVFHTGPLEFQSI